MVARTIKEGFGGKPYTLVARPGVYNYYGAPAKLKGNLAAAGFTPQSGYSLSGTFAYNSTVTLTNLGNPFGSVGPVVLLYDDFAGMSNGTFVAPRTPTAGSQTWSYSAFGSGNAPTMARGNASGTGPAMSHNDHRIPGTGGIFANTLNIQFGASYNAFYMSYHENYRNDFPAGNTMRNCAGGGGGFYKHNWFMNGGGYGASTYDAVIPDSIEESGDLVPAAISWSGGVATVTVANYSAYLPPNFSGTWQTWLTDPHSVNPNFVVSNVTATYIDATHFSYPLANPGTTYTFDSFTSIIMPGGSALHGSGCASGNIDTEVQGNSWGAHGLPSAFSLAGDASDTSKLDPGDAAVYTTGWNTRGFGIVADPVNPNTAVSLVYSVLYNAVNSRCYETRNSSHVCWSATTNYSNVDRVQVPGLLQNTGLCTIDRCNYYLAAGPGAYCRALLADSATLSTATKVQDCDVTSWSAGNISFNLRQGRATALLGSFLHWADVGCNYTYVGHF